VKAKRLNRRDFLRFAAAGLGTVVATACAPKAEPAADSSQVPKPPATQAPVEQPAAASNVVEIHCSIWPDVPDKNINDRTAQLVAEQLPGIKLVPEAYAGDYYDKLKVNFAGGTPPDLAYAEGYNWQPFLPVVSPLDDYIKRDNMASGWADLPHYKNLATWHGKTYLTVIDTGSIVMFYNKTLFDKAEVPYPTDDWTFSDFQAMIPKLTREEDGTKYYGYATCGGAWLGGYVWWIPFLRMDGKLEFDSIVEPKKALWTQSEIVDALQFETCDVIAKGYAPTPDVINGGGVSIATNRVAMGLQGPWYLPQCYGPQAATPDGVSFDVCMPPLGSVGKHMPDAELQGHLLPTACKHPEEAWKVMKLWMGPEVAKITAEEGRMCGTPENTDKYWVPIIRDRFHFDRADVFVKAQLAGNHPVVNGPGANNAAFTGASGPLAVATDAMFGLQKTAKEALTEANSKMQQMLDDYWQKQSS